MCGSTGCKAIKSATFRGGLQKGHRCQGLPETLRRAGNPTITEGSANTSYQHAECLFLPQNISPRGASGPLLVVQRVQLGCTTAPRAEPLGPEHVPRRWRGAGAAHEPQPCRLQRAPSEFLQCAILQRFLKYHCLYIS